MHSDSWEEDAFTRMHSRGEGTKLHYNHITIKNTPVVSIVTSFYPCCAIPSVSISMS